MASTREFLTYVLERLAGTEGLSYRPMMGEYLLYVRGRLVGGVYDDRLLLKASPGALRFLRERGLAPESDIPYPGAKPMLAVDIDRAELPAALVQAVAEEAGGPKTQIKKS